MEHEMIKTKSSSRISMRNSMGRAVQRRQLVKKVNRFRYVSIMTLFLTSIICFFKDWRRTNFIAFDHIMYISFFTTRFLKIFLEYRLQSQPLVTLWDILWSSSNFHALLFEMSLYISRINSFLFIFESLIYSFRKVNRFISIEVAPLMKVSNAKSIQKATASLSKNENLKRLESFIQFCYLPYLLFLVVSKFSGRAFLSLLVNVFVFSPYFYINNRYFNSLWKSLNYTVTGYVLDNSTKKSGQILSKILDYFQQLVDLIAVCYPPKH